MAYGLLADFFKDNGQGNYYQGTAKNTSGETYSPVNYGGLKPFNPNSPTTSGTINPYRFGTEKTTPFQFGYSIPMVGEASLPNSGFPSSISDRATMIPNAPVPQEQSYQGLLPGIYSALASQFGGNLSTNPTTANTSYGTTNTNDWLSKLLQGYGQYHMVY